MTIVAVLLIVTIGGLMAFICGAIMIQSLHLWILEKKGYEITKEKDGYIAIRKGKK